MLLPEGRESQYLADTVGLALQIALAEVSVLRPRDPIEFLARALYRYAENVERNAKEKEERDATSKASIEAEKADQQMSHIYREDHVLKTEQERRKRLYLEREKEVELLNTPRSRHASSSSELGNSQNLGGAEQDPSRLQQSSRLKPKELNVPGNVSGLNSPEALGAMPKSEQDVEQSQGQEEIPNAISDNIIEVPVVTPVSNDVQKDESQTQQEETTEPPKQLEQTTDPSLDNEASNIPQEAVIDSDEVFSKEGGELINVDEGNGVSQTEKAVISQVADVHRSSETIDKAQLEETLGRSLDHSDKGESGATNQFPDVSQGTENQTAFPKQTSIGGEEGKTADVERGNSIDSSTFRADSNVEVTSQINVGQEKVNVDVVDASPDPEIWQTDPENQNTTSKEEQTNLAGGAEDIAGAGEQIDLSEELQEEKEVIGDSSNLLSQEAQQEPDVIVDSSKEDVEQTESASGALEGEEAKEDSDARLYTIGEQDED